MNIEQARELAATLNDAADAAEAAGTDEVDLVSNLQAVDDAARAELEAAIAAAEKAQR